MSETETKEQINMLKKAIGLIRQSIKVLDSRIWGNEDTDRSYYFYQKDMNNILNELNKICSALKIEEIAENKDEENW